MDSTCTVKSNKKKAAKKDQNLTATKKKSLQQQNHITTNYLHQNNTQPLMKPKTTPTITLSRGSIPIIGLGTWKLYGAQCENAVQNALSMGYRHIDTAELYRNESEIGKSIQQSGTDRDELFITSKVLPQNADYNDTIAACKRSLERLQTDYLDLYLLHWPSNVPLGETFHAFHTLQEEGKIRNAGISNFNEEQTNTALKAAKTADIQIAVNQVEFHPYLYQKKLLEFCRKNGVHVTAYCPVARGALANDPALKGIAKRHEKTVAQVSLAWLMQHGLSVIPKAAKETHLKENLDSLEFKLTAQDMTEINNINIYKRLVTL